jgi:hypothetical protein
MHIAPSIISTIRPDCPDAVLSIRSCVSLDGSLIGSQNVISLFCLTDLHHRVCCCSGSIQQQSSRKQHALPVPKSHFPRPIHNGTNVHENVLQIESLGQRAGEGESDGEGEGKGKGEGESVGCRV